MGDRSDDSRCRRLLMLRLGSDANAWAMRGVGGKTREASFGGCGNEGCRHLDLAS